MGNSATTERRIQPLQTTSEALSHERKQQHDHGRNHRRDRPHHHRNRHGNRENNEHRHNSNDHHRHCNHGRRQRRSQTHRRRRRCNNSSTLDDQGDNNTLVRCTIRRFLDSTDSLRVVTNGYDTFCTEAPPTCLYTIRKLKQFEILKVEDFFRHYPCHICCESYELHSIVKQLPCGHFFHTACIDDWLNRHCTCPVCRYDLPSSDLLYEFGRMKLAAKKKKQDKKNNNKSKNTCEAKRCSYFCGDSNGRESVENNNQFANNSILSVYTMDGVAEEVHVSYSSDESTCPSLDMERSSS